MTEREATFHWAFDDQRVAYKCPGWQFNCEAPECQRGICRKCHVPVDDRRQYCADCVAEDVDPRASSFAHRARARKLHDAFEELLSYFSDNDGDWYMYDPKIDGDTMKQWRALLNGGKAA